MASAEKKNKPSLGRKNTFQKMLDLEQANKVNRMRASSPFPLITSTPKSPPPPRSSVRQHPPLPLSLPSMDRSMTAPTLTLEMPPSNFANNGPSLKYIIKPSGDLVPQDDELSEPESAISSICQSPGWDDYNGKKRKMVKEAERERRRKELERTSEQSQHVQLLQNPLPQSKRLSKAPPTNKRLSKLAISSERSMSAPAIPTLPTMARGDVKKEPKKLAEDKAKRASSEVGGLRGIIPGPWKSAQNSSSSRNPTQEAFPSRDSFSSKPAYNDGGFIGGVKFDQFRQTGTTTTTQVQKHEDKKDGWSDGAGEATSHNERGPSPQAAEISSSSTSMAESLRPISIYDELVRTPRDWDDVYTQNSAAARGLASPAKSSEDDMPMMDRNVRRNRSSHPPTSRHFPADNENSGSSQRDSSNGSRTSLSRTPNTERKNDHMHTLSPVVSQVTPPDSNITSDRGRAELQTTNERISREAEVQPSNAATSIKKSYPPESRGRADYARFQQREEENNSASASRDVSVNSDTGSKKKSRRRSFSSLFTRSRSRNRSTSKGPAPGTASPTPKKDGSITTSFSTIGSKSSKKDAKPSGPYLDEGYVLNQLHHELTTKAAESSAPGNKRATSKGPSFKGLKSAAKSAFFRHSISSPDSPTGSFPASLEIPESRRSWSSMRTTIDVASPHISSQMTSDTLSAREPLPTSSLARSPARRHNDVERSPRDSALKALNGSQSSHTRSATDSSEDYSTLDESSNTTPNASRPPSQKDYFSGKGDSNPEESVNESSSTPRSPQAPDMTGLTLVDEPTISKSSWGKSGAGMEVQTEDHLKPPTEKRSIFGYTSTQLNNSSPQVPQVPMISPTDATDLERKPSLSRSTSNPEVQDLSFLPTLKHQSLTRPIKGKGKAKPPAPLKLSPKETARIAADALNALARPPRSTKPEGISPKPPQSSQYLHNARLAIPGARSPTHSQTNLNSPFGSKTTFPPAPSHTNNTDPIAKMFVICCQCKYFHDMPSKVYECMAKPDNVVTDSNLGVSGMISTSVKCPWCAHRMSTSCCEGYAAVVYLSEKLHGGAQTEIWSK